MPETPIMRVLLIDDDEDDCIIVRDLLEGLAPQRYVVEWTRDGEQALRQIRSRAFDACLLDDHLAGEDGIEVLRRIVAEPAHPAVIMVTGQGSDEVDQQALDIGAADYLAKQEMTGRVLDRSIRYAAGQRRLLLALEEREASLRLSRRAIEAALNGILICDARVPDYPISFVNPAFERITGYRASEALGRNPRFLGGMDAQAQGLPEIRQALSEQREAHVLLCNYRKDGTLFWNDMFLSPVRDENEGVTHFIGVINDVTENRRYAEQLAYQANHDALTGLPNRNLLNDRLTQAIGFANRHGRHRVAVMLIDLDQFKVINDGIGHHVGDALLQQVAQRLSGIVREGDTVSRLGGDEFVIVCPDLSREEDALHVMQRIHASLERPIAVDGEVFNISASIGVAFYPKDGDQVSVLLRHAGLAMYRAKDSGRATYRYFTPELNTRMSQRVQMESRLRGALKAQEFELFYQPQVNAVSGEVSGMEALIRWRHPDLGLVMPGQFIQVAEESGLIVPIGDWVLYEACRQMASWQKECGIRVPVAINISVAQLSRRDFAQVVSAALNETGLDASFLELELTESMVMDSAESFVSLVQKLSTLGVRITIDDFGTGYSSLAYLKRLPVDRLKIDYSFVRDIVVHPGDAAICRAIIAMAHSMRLAVVAEGVETEAQAVYLGRHGCDDLQGFFMSRPVPAEYIPDLLRGDRPLFSPPEELKTGRTLLIVDDEPNVITSLRRLLRADGYNILSATTSEQGFDLLATCEEISVVIADQRMPGMTGTEFLERVKELYPRTVRIVLSGFTDLQTVTSSVNRGAVYKFLLKPWDNEELRGEIREAFWHVELNQFGSAETPVRQAPAWRYAGGVIR